MEAQARGEILISGVTVVVSDAVPGTENPNLVSGSSAPAVVAQVSVAPAGEATPAAGTGGSVLSLKKKRGRPRKYGPDGSITALSPKPISSSAAPARRPPVIDFSTGKRGKIRGVGSGMKFRQQSNLVNNKGEWVSCSVGSSFTPHMITVNAGEDVTMKVISFSQQGPRAICIISANGVISSVTLRHPDSSGGTLTYEGRFEILSLTGSFMASEDGGGGFKNRSGGMSVSLASPDGRVVGGSVAGLLVAATPVQIVVGSFLAVDHKPNKVMKNDSNSSNEQEAYTSSSPPVVIANQNQKPRNNIQTDINVSPPPG